MGILVLYSPASYLALATDFLFRGSKLCLGGLTPSHTGYGAASSPVFQQTTNTSPSAD